MPPMADSPIAADKPYHKALWDKGVALRVIAQTVHTQNMLHAPGHRNRNRQCAH
jgi:hypothetical protein